MARQGLQEQDGDQLRAGTQQTRDKPPGDAEDITQSSTSSILMPAEGVQQPQSGDPMAKGWMNLASMGRQGILVAGAHRPHQCHLGKHQSEGFAASPLLKSC